MHNIADSDGILDPDLHAQSPCSVVELDALASDCECESDESDVEFFEEMSNMDEMIGDVFETETPVIDESPLYTGSSITGFVALLLVLKFTLRLGKH